MPELPRELVERCAEAMYDAQWDANECRFRQAHASDQYDCRVTARLILEAAHVPELLEALEYVVGYLDGMLAYCNQDKGCGCGECGLVTNCYLHETLRRARAALKRAGVSV